MSAPDGAGSSPLVRALGLAWETIRVRHPEFPTVVVVLAAGSVYAVEAIGQSVTGPPLGGLTFAVVPCVPFVLDVASFALSAALLGRIPRGEAPPRRAEQTVVASVREGFTYVLRDRELFGLALAVAGYSVAYNLGFATLVLFALEHLHTWRLGSAF